MASTSSSSQRYQVFVSFRGEDTRNNFTDHLVAALRRRCINAYIDDANLKAGDEISEALKEAIQSSRICIVVLSENYASSAWCLNELLCILECKQRQNQVVVPIFYHVNPNDVRYQKASFADAFAKHSRRRSAHEVQNWKSALTQVANLSGHHFTIRQRSEHEFIEKIAKDISTRLTSESSNDFQDLVGIHSRIQQITSLLRFDSKEVVKVGIWGMGGIGKTTTASAVFHQFSAQFEGCHFIPNVREDFGKYGGHISLRNKLVSSILGEECQEISPVIQDRLQCKKVIVVLDDVNDSIQLDFIRPRRCFGDGSRIIITSRDRQVLQQVVDEIYEVKGLIKGEDLQLFCSFAFKERYPEDEFEALSHRFLEYAKGVPLALKVLGSALKGKSSREWESFLHKLKETPNPTIQKILKISYDDLDYTQQDLFLDIACFFRHNSKASVSKIYGASADYDIGVLIDKSLIVVTEWGSLDMHDLLQEMGWDIVCQESVKEPGKRSRLWKQEDVYCVLQTNTGTEVVQGMMLDMDEMRDLDLTPTVFERMKNELHITSTAFERMKNLRLINFCSDDSFLFRSARNIHVAGDALYSLSNKLNYLRWDKCPLKSLPLQFCAENLVQLIMPFSNLEKLWGGEQNLVNLKQIDLRCSERLLEIPNLSQARVLESVDLRDCKSLCDLPNCTGVTSLRTLNLKGCSKLTKFPESYKSVRDLNLSGTGIQEVPASIGGFSRLKYLYLKNCERLQIIPRSICQLESLEHNELRLSSFSNLKRSEELLGSVECVNIERSECKLSTKQIKLVVNFNDRNSAEMEWFRNCMSCMTSLKEVHCFTELPGELHYSLQNLQSLETVSLKDFNSRKFPSYLAYLFPLKDLKLTFDKVERIPESIKQLSALEKLDLSFCRRLQCLPNSIKQFSALEMLNLSCCTGLQSLPELPTGIKYLRAYGCKSLVSVSTPLTMSACVRIITFMNSFILDTSSLENEAQYITLRRAQEDMKLCNKGCIDNPPIIISYPGSEIPKWFSYQSMRPSITIKLPPHRHDNKFFGIAFVAILDVVSPLLDIGVKCEFKSECGLSHKFDMPLIKLGEPLNGFTFHDHVVIGYSCRWYCELLKFGDLHVHEASFLFSAKIKKCGVSFLYTRVAEDCMTYNENDALPCQKRMKHTQQLC